MTNDVHDGPPRPDIADMGQGDLIERVKHVLSQDARVLGLWLVGSYARGTNDRFSDVDLWVVVDATDVDGFCDDWPRICGEIAPTVLQRRVGDRPIFNQITPDWLRFDLSVGTPEAIVGRTRSTVSPLYDPNGLSAGLREPGPLKLPDPGRVGSITREFLARAWAAARRDRARRVRGGPIRGGAVAVHVDRRDARGGRGGGPGWRVAFEPAVPAHRQQVLTDLPPLRATRDSVIAGHVA